MRIAVYKKVKKIQLKAVRIGRSFAVAKKDVIGTAEKELEDKEKRMIDEVVTRTVKEYGEVLWRLGKE